MPVRQRADMRGPGGVVEPRVHLRRRVLPDRLLPERRDVRDVDLELRVRGRRRELHRLRGGGHRRLLGRLVHVRERGRVRRGAGVHGRQVRVHRVVVRQRLLQRQRVRGADAGCVRDGGRGVPQLRHLRRWMQRRGRVHLRRRGGLRSRAGRRGGLRLQRKLVPEWLLQWHHVRARDHHDLLRDRRVRLRDVPRAHVHGGGLQRLLRRQLRDGLLQRVDVHEPDDRRGVRHGTAPAACPATRSAATAAGLPAPASAARAASVRSGRCAPAPTARATRRRVRTAAARATGRARPRSSRPAAWWEQVARPAARSSDNCSSSGVCQCGASSACAPGQVCSNGVCACNATSCPDGCCAPTGRARRPPPPRLRPSAAGPRARPARSAPPSATAAAAAERARAAAARSARRASIARVGPASATGPPAAGAARTAPAWRATPPSSAVRRGAAASIAEPSPTDARPPASARVAERPRARRPRPARRGRAPWRARAAPRLVTAATASAPAPAAATRSARRASTAPTEPACATRPHARDAATGTTTARPAPTRWHAVTPAVLASPALPTETAAATRANARAPASRPARGGRRARGTTAAASDGACSGRRYASRTQHVCRCRERSSLLRSALEVLPMTRTRLACVSPFAFAAGMLLVHCSEQQRLAGGRRRGEHEAGQHRDQRGFEREQVQRHYRDHRHRPVVGRWHQHDRERLGGQQRSPHGHARRGPLRRPRGWVGL